MALLRKKNPEWNPSEDKGLLVGDTIEISDYRRLVELGMADLVDDLGNVLPLPGTVFVCGICFEGIDSHEKYVTHIMEAHSTSTTPAVVVEENEEVNGIKIPTSFGKKMAEARKAAKAKREEEKKKQES